MATDAIILALQSLKSATDVLGAIRQAERSLESAEFKLRIADLATALAEARIQIADVQQYVRDLEEHVAKREALSFDRETNVYRDSTGAPFCPKCFDGEGKACRMEERDSATSWKCLTCDRTVWKPGFPKRPPKARPTGSNWVKNY